MFYLELFWNLYKVKYYTYYHLWSSISNYVKEETNALELQFEKKQFFRIFFDPQFLLQFGAAVLQCFTTSFYDNLSLLVNPSLWPTIPHAWNAIFGQSNLPNCERHIACLLALKFNHNFIS
jgi:hypothetical protein